jgi:hypothetical protein
VKRHVEPALSSVNAGANHATFGRKG